MSDRGRSHNRGTAARPAEARARTARAGRNRLPGRRHRRAGSRTSRQGAVPARKAGRARPRRARRRLADQGSHGGARPRSPTVRGGSRQDRAALEASSSPRSRTFARTGTRRPTESVPGAMELPDEDDEPQTSTSSRSGRREDGGRAGRGRTSRTRATTPTSPTHSGPPRAQNDTAAAGRVSTKGSRWPSCTTHSRAGVDDRSRPTLLKPIQRTSPRRPPRRGAHGNSPRA